MAGIFTEEKEGGLDIDMGREHHMEMEADTGVSCLQAKEQHALLATPRRKKRDWNRISLTTSRSNQTCWHLDFGLLASRAVREYISAA